MARYTCMNCNHPWDLDDPGFDYYRPYGENHWAVRLGLVEAGAHMKGLEGIHPETGKPFKIRQDTRGWFARCVDQEQCAQWRRNLHAGLNYEQQELVV